LFNPHRAKDLQVEIGIIGFQKSGKTTVFNALTGQEAQVSAFSTSKIEPNLAVVAVPDERLWRLSELYKPKKTTPAAVHYVDLAGIARGRKEDEDGLGDAQIHAIAQSDALMAVIRGFEDVSGDPPDPLAEAEAMLLEMTLSDLQKVENRIERLAKSKGKVTGEEAKRDAMELAALERVKPLLEDGQPVRAVDLSEDEARLLRGFQFLTQKPLMLVLNAPEDALAGDGDPASPLQQLAAQPGLSVTWLAGQAESEISRLNADERSDFLSEYGIAEPAAAKITRLSYELLGLISFITVGQDECRAWTVKNGALAPEAAGEVHSDLERGFIRAEVCRWDDLLDAGSTAELKKLGKLRLEGKNYTVQDGDVLNILFNV